MSEESTVEHPHGKVYEKKLLESISKTHSVLAFLKAFGLDILIYGLIFKAGQRKVSLVWLIPPIVVLFIKDVWSEERDKRRFKKIVETLRDDEKQLVLKDSTRLPPWVHFPDIERCSWLNKLLIHFWPYIGGIISEKVLTLSKEHKVPGLELKKASFGKVPPTVSGIKVYDKNVSHSHLVIDANLCYSGDCEFGITYRGIPGGIENFQLSGSARIILLVVEKLPFIGGVEFSFLGSPQIDFSLTGIGSLGVTEEALREVINYQISSIAVFPKKVRQVWTEFPEENLQNPKGVIRVNVVEAKDLENQDGLFAGKSDPYAVISYGSKKFWSRVIDECLTPTWDFWCEFAMDGNGKQTIDIKVMDQDPGTSDDFIGRLTLKESDIKKEGKLDSWRKLEGSKGSIHIRASFLEVTSNLEDVKFPPEEFSFFSTFVLTVLVKSAHNLTVPRSERKPSSIVQLSVGNDTQETKKVENTNNPVFNDCFTFFVNNPDFNKLRVKFVDQESKVEIGSFSYSLRKLLDRKDLEIIDQNFSVMDSASDSTVVVSMRMRVIKNVF